MKQTLILAMSVFIYSASFCQAGRLDKTFGNNGKVVTRFSGNAILNSIAIQADGKIVAAGFSDGNFALARYNGNGTLDKTFGINGRVITDLGKYEEATSVAVQADGKIVAAGYTQTGSYPNIKSNIAIVRYNKNGSLDKSFGNNGKNITDVGKEDYGNSMVIQSDGKIIVTGTTINDMYDFSNIIVLRYNTNGSLDNTFGSDGKVITGYDDFLESDDKGNAVALQSDGKIVVTGLTEDDAGFDVYIALIRYNTNGTLDTTFGISGKAERYYFSPALASALVIQKNGKIVIAGRGYNDDNSYYQFALLARYNPDGTPDKTYGKEGAVFVSPYYNNEEHELHSIVLQPDGKTISTGYQDFGSTVAAVRYNINGKRDSTFGKDGRVSYSNENLLSHYGGSAYPVALQSDGKIVIGGNYDSSFSVVRLLNDDTAAKTNTTEAIVNHTTGDKNFLIRLYPNPVMDNLVIDGLNSDLQATFTIADLLGHIIRLEKMGANKNVIDVSTFKAGCYIVIIKQNNKITTLKFIKQ